MTRGIGGLFVLLAAAFTAACGGGGSNMMGPDMGGPGRGSSAGVAFLFVPAGGAVAEAGRGI